MSFGADGSKIFRNISIIFNTFIITELDIFRHLLPLLHQTDYERVSVNFIFRLQNSFRVGHLLWQEQHNTVEHLGVSDYLLMLVDLLRSRHLRVH